MNKRKGVEAETPIKQITMSKLIGVNLIATTPSYYDKAVNTAIMLTVEDPSAGNGVTDAQIKLKATENLLSRFPV